MSSKEVFVSIIMPAYNCEKHIGDAIKSVLAQTHIYWELLVIDDGSNDDTFRVISEFGEIDSRIKPQRNKKNMGVSATRNKGIEMASSEWIAFLDSDDMWVPSKLEKQLKMTRNNSIDFVFTGVSYINEKGEFYRGIFEVPEKVTYEKLRNQNVISCSSVLIKKQYLENIKMERDDIHEDYAVWLRILRSGITAYSINEPLLIYRISKSSKSGHKLKTINMTYKVFRFIGINPIGAAYFMCRHAIASLRKYRKIF